MHKVHQFSRLPPRIFDQLGNNRLKSETMGARKVGWIQFLICPRTTSKSFNNWCHRSRRRDRCQCSTKNSSVSLPKNSCSKWFNSSKPWSSRTLRPNLHFRYRQDLEELGRPNAPVLAEFLKIIRMQELELRSILKTCRQSAQVADELLKTPRPRGKKKSPLKVEEEERSSQDRAFF